MAEQDHSARVTRKAGPRGETHPPIPAGSAGSRPDPETEGPNPRVLPEPDAADPEAGIDDVRAVPNAKNDPDLPPAAREEEPEA